MGMMFTTKVAIKIPTPTMKNPYINRFLKMFGKCLKIFHIHYNSNIIVHNHKVNPKSIIMGVISYLGLQYYIVAHILIEMNELVMLTYFSSNIPPQGWFSQIWNQLRNQCFPGKKKR